jgi:hypothetical protein
MEMAPLVSFGLTLTNSFLTSLGLTVRAAVASGTEMN